MFLPHADDVLTSALDGGTNRPMTCYIAPLSAFTQLAARKGHSVCARSGASKRSRVSGSTIRHGSRKLCACSRISCSTATTSVSAPVRRPSLWLAGMRSLPYTEEIGPAGEGLGNAVQGFTFVHTCPEPPHCANILFRHVTLISAAYNLSRTLDHGSL